MRSAQNHPQDLSYRQLRAVDLWVADGRKSKAKALRDAKYSEAIARQPHKVFDTPAVRAELERRGYGSRGNMSSKTPKERVTAVMLKPITALDPPMLTDKQIIELAALLAALPPAPALVTRTPEDSSSSRVPDGSWIDVFGERVRPQAPVEGMASYSVM